MSLSLEEIWGINGPPKETNKKIHIILRKIIIIKRHINLKLLLVMVNLYCLINGSWQVCWFSEELGDVVENINEWFRFSCTHNKWYSDKNLKFIL